MDTYTKRPFGRDHDLRGRQHPRAARPRNGRQDLQLVEVRIGEGADGHVGFAIDVDVPTVRVKAQVARRGAGVDAAERRIVGHQLASASVEPVAHDLVDAFVVDQDALAGRVERDEVRVRAFLGRPGPRALVLQQVGARSESTVGVDWEDRDAAVLVIGDDHPLAARVDAQVARLAAARLLAIDRATARRSLDRA